nr:MAG TPA: hypothetical protein [Caudoviricetes sp.]
MPLAAEGEAPLNARWHKATNRISIYINLYKGLVEQR